MNEQSDRDTSKRRKDVKKAADVAERIFNLPEGTLQ
jgi:hypothetical protein